MTEITLPLDLSKINAFGITRDLARRFYGPVPMIVGLSAALVACAATALALRSLYGPLFFGVMALKWVYPLVAAILTTRLLNRYYRRKLERALLASPHRRATEITLTALGIARGGSRVPWSDITEVISHRQAIRLLLSPTEYIPLIRATLPQGITAETLQSQITKWRTA
ncbi:MAG: hypothetical protein WCC57_04525 [Paracoccaceae bacterium]